MDLIDRVASLRLQRKKAALCIITSTSGVTSRKAGSKMMVFEDGAIEGSVGGGSHEAKTIEVAKETIRKGEPTTFVIDQGKEPDPHCGGIINLYIEPILPADKAIILGAGHVGRCVGELLNRLGFEVTMVDKRSDIKPFDNEPIKVKTGDLFEIIEEISLDEQSYIFIATSDHSEDEHLLSACIHQPHAYIGMLASKKKTAKIKQNLLNSGKVSESQLTEIDMPAGLPIHAHTPEEIAVSVAARIIEIRNRKS